jgi:hypothetical protein
VNLWRQDSSDEEEVAAQDYNMDDEDASSHNNPDDASTSNNAAINNSSESVIDINDERSPLITRLASRDSTTAGLIITASSSSLDAMTDYTPMTTNSVSPSQPSFTAANTPMTANSIRPMSINLRGFPTSGPGEHSTPLLAGIAGEFSDTPRGMATSSSITSPVEPSEQVIDDARIPSARDGLSAVAGVSHVESVAAQASAIEASIASSVSAEIEGDHGRAISAASNESGAPIKRIESVDKSRTVAVAVSTSIYEEDASSGGIESSGDSCSTLSTITLATGLMPVSPSSPITATTSASAVVSPLSTVSTPSHTPVQPASGRNDGLGSFSCDSVNSSPVVHVHNVSGERKRSGSKVWLTV